MLNVFMCAGALTCEPVWGYVVAFVKINNIPAVFNIPATHALLTHNAAIGPVEEPPQSPTVLSHRLAGQIFYFPVVACLLC